MPDEVRSGLALILFELYHFDVRKEFPDFRKVYHYFSEFSDEKIKKIGHGIYWALDHKETMFNKILPRQNKFENERVVEFLEYIYVSFVDFGLYKPYSQVNSADWK